MNELSIEQKAKRYDEAVNEIRNLRDMLLKEGVINKNGVIYDNFNRILPELKENEDAEIRKEMITYLSTVEDKELIPYERWIAWLEKHGEQKPTDKIEPKFHEGDWVTIKQ